MSRNSKVEIVQSQIDDIRNVMYQNIDKVISRGEKLEVICEKAENLEADSISFQKNSASIRAKMCWNAYKLYVCGSFIVGTVITIGTLIIYYSVKK